MAHGKNKGHVNKNKGAKFQSAKGRKGDKKPSNNSNGREKNIGHSKGEEHSRVAKGSSGKQRGNKVSGKWWG